MDIENVFKYHAPTPEDLIKYQRIREAGKELAEMIIRNTYEGPDQDHALRCVREAVMFANASVALRGCT